MKSRPYDPWDLRRLLRDEPERKGVGEQNRIGRDTRVIASSEKKAEKLIDRYHAFEERYQRLKERGGTRFSMSEAKDQMGRCAHEICRDKQAMNYLHKNDKDLFKEMSKTIEREKALEKSKGFELEL